MITFKHARVNQELPTVLLIAPTGVAAKNINETTIYSALSIPKEVEIMYLHCHTAGKHSYECHQLSEIKLIIIDEISMVSNSALLHIHQT